MIKAQEDENDDENVWNASAVILDIDSGVQSDPFLFPVSVFGVNLT